MNRVLPAAARALGARDASARASAPASAAARGAAATIDEARAWMPAEPSMRAGALRFEVHPCGVFHRGSVGR
ncbi:MAG TPA: hypothetical protein VFQ20_13035 [Burkholderiaceae bacterium]|nr:hypothetical protein [Burkholderiaceae bacterium]